MHRRERSVVRARCRRWIAGARRPERRTSHRMSARTANCLRASTQSAVANGPARHPRVFHVRRDRSGRSAPVCNFARCAIVQNRFVVVVNYDIGLTNSNGGNVDQCGPVRRCWHDSLSVPSPPGRAGALAPGGGGDVEVGSVMAYVPITRCRLPPPRSRGASAPCLRRPARSGREALGREDPA